MFIFPAFNDSYKTRKRTFRCCKVCRVKRIRCTILNASYEKEGCDNCKISGAQCDLVKAQNSTKKTLKKINTHQEVVNISEPEITPAIQSKPNFTFDPDNTTNLLSRNRDITQDVDKSFPSIPKTLGVPFSNPNLEYPPNRMPSSFSVPNNFLNPPNSLLYELPRPNSQQNYSANLNNGYNLNFIPHGLLKGPQSFGSGEHLLPLPGLSTVLPRSLSSPQNHIQSSHISQTKDSSFQNKNIPKQLGDCGTYEKKSTDFSRVSIPEINLKSPSDRKPEGVSTGKVLSKDSFSSSEKVSHTYHSLSNTINQDITNIDHRFLKEKFNFNCRFRQSKFFSTKTLIINPENPEEEGSKAHISKQLLTRSKFLDKSNLLHFKFLLSLHAFTLDTPGFYNIQPEDVVKLYEIYFYKVNSIFPIVFEEEFWELHQRDKIPNILIYAIVLNAANDELSEPILARSFVDNDVTFEENYARFLKELEMKIRQLLEFLPELGDTEKLSRLITLLLLSINFRYNKFGNEQSSSDVGDSISYAFSLLIHNEYFHAMIVKVGASKKSAYLRRLWWVIFIFDRFNALLNGKAMFIKRVDFNIERPLDLPHLDRLVLLAYSLEDTLVAAFRPQRTSTENSNRIIDEYVDGDPVFNPTQIMNDEIYFLDNTEDIERILKIEKPMKEDDGNHLPEVEVEVYRDRFVFFMERLLRHQIILVFRTGQFKVLRETSQIDVLGLRLSKNLLRIFQMLKCDQNHKLVMATPLIPLMLLVSLSVPSFARYSLFRRSKEGDKEITDQLTRLIEDYMTELGMFSKKFWFLHEVITSLAKKHDTDSKKSTESISPDLEYITPKHHTISINSLVNDAADAECILPSLFSITSPGFYEDAMVEDDSEEEDKQMPKLRSDQIGGPAKENKEKNSRPNSSKQQTANFEASPTRRKSAPDYEGMLTGYTGLDDSSCRTTSLADDLNFDVAQLAEMVSVDTNFIPHVMDFFPDSEQNFFF